MTRKKFLSGVAGVVAGGTLTTASTDVAAAAGTTYYVDATDGDDSNDGQSQSSAWQSLDKVNNTTFEPGDHVLFKKGEVWNGRLYPKGSGTSSDPIVVDSYGNGNAPIINGQGQVNGTVTLKYQDYVEIRNLEVTNTDGSSGEQGDINGIYVVAKDSGDHEGIRIIGNYVHDVNGEVAEKGRGGIRFEVFGSTTKTRFNDVEIRDNTVENVGGIGISNQSSWGAITESDWYPWLNYHVRDNYIDTTGRNACIMRDADTPVFEYNTIANSTRWGDAGHSVYNWDCKSTKMQFNEAYGNTGAEDDKDRGSYDADGNCKKTRIQYNYSHDNHWGFGVMRRPPNDNVKVRFNVSEDEEYGCVIFGWADYEGLRDVEIYNNTFYFSSGNSANIIYDWTNEGREPAYTTFKNNIFAFAGSGSTGPTNNDASHVTWDNNLFWNVPTVGSNTISANPDLANPGNGGTDIDLRDSNRLSGYKLQEGSPALGSAASLDWNGGRDYWGNYVADTGPTNLGAYNGSGVSGDFSGTHFIVNESSGSNLYTSNSEYNSSGAYYDVTWPTQESWSSMHWEFQEVSSGVYHIVNQEAGGYLYASDEAYSGYEEATYAVTWPDKESWDSMKWEMREVSSGVYKIVNVGDGSYLYPSDEAYSGGDNAYHVVCWPTNKDWESFKWSLSSV